MGEVAAAETQLFRRLLAGAPMDLHPRVLSKGTLTELSHVLENLVIDHDLDGAVFTGFQESGNWLRALDTYHRLVHPRARSVAVFASGNVDSIGDDDIVKVRLAEDDPLVEEWFLVVLTTHFSAVLMGGELPTDWSREADREFDTVIALTPRRVRWISEFIRDEVAARDAEAARRIDEALARFAPGPPHDGLQDLVLGEIVSTIEAGRSRARAAAEQLGEARDQLAALDRAKNAFLSAVSHELRTPMTIVHGMAQTLERIGEQMSAGDRRQTMRALVDATDRLRDLLVDLVDVDRMIRGGLSAVPTPLDAVAVVRATVAEAAPEAAPGRFVFDTPDELPVELDRLQFQRTVTNLVTNAQKYAPDGTVRIRVEPWRDGVRLTVDDEGPGLGDLERDRVFRAFHRVDVDHPQPGTGIGLTLVAEFARLHGGSARFEDAPSGGARVVVELDVPDGPTAPTA